VDGLVVAVDIMAVADVASRHHDAIGAAKECLDDKVWIDAAAAHESDDAHI